jgi:hypothetical protein
LKPLAERSCFSIWSTLKHPECLPARLNPLPALLSPLAERSCFSQVYTFQRANSDAVFSAPELDALVRHPKILPLVRLTYCPGRNPAFLTVKRPARPYKSTIENRFTSENAKGA